MKAEKFEVELGKKLEKLRKSKKKTQDEVAKELGLKSRETVKQWETWDRHIKANDLKKLAEYYGVPSDYLLGLYPYPAMNQSERFVLEYTGLSSEALRLISSSSLVQDTINVMASGFASKSSLLDVPLYKLSFYFERMKKEMEEAGVAILEKEGQLEYGEAKAKELTLKVNLMEFNEVCQHLPREALPIVPVIEKLEQITQEH